MKNLARFIYYRSKAIIIITVIINIIALLSLFNFSLSTDYLSFFKGNNEISSVYDEINDKYKGIETIQILIESKDDSDLTSKNNLMAISLYLESLKEIEGTSFTTSFLPQKTTTGINEIIEIDSNYIRSNYEQTLTIIESNDMLNSFISENNKAGLVILGMNNEIDKKLYADKVTEIMIDDNLTTNYAGNQIIVNTLEDYLIKIILIFPPLAIILVLFVFYLNIRNKIATIFAMLPASFGALWMFGTVFLLDKELSIITVLAPIFIIVLGSADGLHFTIHYLENADKYSDKVDLIEETLRMVGIPIILTTLTTMAGFLSLAFSDITSMRELGITTAVGIGYAGLISIFFLPILLTKLKLDNDYNSIENSKLIKFIKKAKNYRIAIITTFATLVIFFGIFIPTLTVDSNQLTFFKKGSDIVQTFDKVEEHFGSALPLFGEYKLPKDGLDNIDKANEILIFERELEEMETVNNVMSIYDLILYGNQMMTGKNSYPENPETINKITTYITTNEEIDLEQWISNDGLKFNITTTNLSGEAQDQLIKKIEENKNVKSLSGMPILFREMNKLIVENQINSLFIALALIFVMLYISFRKLKDTLVALVPIIITIISLFGFLALTDFNLNMMTTNMASIAIGVGIDYAIHFISVMNLYKKRNVVNYIDKAIETAGKPIITNALGFAIGLSIYLLSPFRIHSQVSMVMWLAMIISSFGALLLIPQFYRKTKD